MPYISGGWAIHHTIRLLQTFRDIINNTGAQNRAVAIQGCFGPHPWVQGKSAKIAGDMDELLMAEILPKFITLFRHGILGKAVLPMVDELAPLWLNIRDYVRHPERAVSWPLVFSVHALLTAILETDNITDSLMDLSESAFQTFFKQVESASNLLPNEPDSTLLNDSRFCHNIAAILSLQNLGLPVFGKRAIWSPLYAGTTLSYILFFGNMEVGCSVLDGRAQLRMVMFLYHGLMLNGIIKSGQIPFLDIMYASFKDSWAIWEGPLRCRGELVQRFWTSCHGLNLVNSKIMANEAREMYASSRTLAGGTADMAGAFLGRSRKMNPIQPEDVCKSYRRVCNLDFHDTTHQSNKNGVSIRMPTCWWYASMTLLMQLMRSKSCYPSILLLALLFLSKLFAAWHELCHGDPWCKYTSTPIQCFNLIIVREQSNFSSNTCLLPSIFCQTHWIASFFVCHWGAHQLHFS